RGYIIEKFNKLIPTKKGLTVDHFLTQNYSEFVDEKRTTELLKKIDEIEQGKRKPLDVVFELLKEIQNLMAHNQS
ncbi:MAG: DNA topoisomerase, partial [bacterium]